MLFDTELLSFTADPWRVMDPREKEGHNLNRSGNRPGKNCDDVAAVKNLQKKRIFRVFQISYPIFQRLLKICYSHIKIFIIVKE